MVKKAIILSRVCFVDETIENNSKLFYIAIVAKKSENFDTFKNIDKVVKTNLNKIKNKNIRNSARNFWKSQHVLMVTEGVNNAKKLIKLSEFHEIKKFSSGASKQELINRTTALKTLISKIECTTFFIDDYANKSFREEIKEHASKLKKIVVFVNSRSSEGVRLADLFLKLY